MLTTKLQLPEWGDATSWKWALERGHIFRVYAPDRTRFDVLILGSADFVAVNIGSDGCYNPDAMLRLYSVNGEFRMWVEEGMNGRIRGVRWTVEFDTYSDEHYKPHWRTSGDCLNALAVEQIFGEVVNADGEVIDTK